MKGLGERWYVVQTQPHAEAKAVSHLLRQGFTTYFPRCLKQRRHARKIETVAAPFFPGYVFVASIWRCSGGGPSSRRSASTRLVCHGDDPALVPQRVLEEIRRKEDENGFVRLRREMRSRPATKSVSTTGRFRNVMVCSKRNRKGPRRNSIGFAGPKSPGQVGGRPDSSRVS